MQMLLRHCCNCSHAPAAAAMLLRGQRAVVYKADVGLSSCSRASARLGASRSSHTSERQQSRRTCAAATATAEAQQAGDSSTAPETGRQSDGDAAALAADEWIEIGLIRSVHGLRGEMKVEPLTDSPAERLGTPGARWLQQPEVPGLRQNLPPPTQVAIEAGRATVSKGRKVWLVKLEGTDSPEAADALRGCKLLIRPMDRPPLDDEDEFYAQDLVGMTVVQHGSGTTLGNVVDIYDGTGTHNVLRILLEADDPADARTVLVPFQKSIVPHIDAEARRMTIDPPEGLFDTAVPARRKRRNPRNKPPKL